MCKIIAIVNQKGGVGKTTTAISLAVALSKQNRKVLLVDFDSQASMTIALGTSCPGDIENSVAALMLSVMEEEPINTAEFTLKSNGIDYIASNRALSGMEVQLMNELGREYILKRSLEHFKASYDYIIIDCMPGLGIMIINALVAADSVIIPVLAHPLGAKGLEDFLKTVKQVRRLNSELKIDGILITMFKQLKFCRQIKDMIIDKFSEDICIFDTVIPESVKVVEASGYGQNIIDYAPNNPVATAYIKFAEELIANG